jgi:hypothetical protein
VSAITNSFYLKFFDSSLVYEGGRRYFLLLRDSNYFFPMKEDIAKNPNKIPLRNLKDLY